MAGFAEERRYSVPLFGAAEDQRQGFVRLVNRNAATGTAVIYAIDDAGERRGPVTLEFAARQALHVNSDDLQKGNAAKGIEGVGTPGAGDWRLEIASELDLEVLAYLRTTPGGFLASMHDIAPEADGTHRIAIFNPGSNANQRSRLRLVNAGAKAAVVTIRGVDDAGQAGAAEIRLVVPGGEARTFDAKDMEEGNASLFQGALGDGDGKWRLTVSADQPIQAMSLLDARETGLRANLSTAPANAETSDGATTHRVPLFPPKSHSARQGFLRVVNRSPQAGTVRITAMDDEGASYGPLTLTIAAGRTAHFNSADLEDGNADKGLSGGIGDGDGSWRLALRTSLDIDVLAYIRTKDGFLASMHDLAPATANSHRVAIFNPARNTNQKSMLRLINDNDQDAAVAIVGVDDGGSAGADAVRIVIPANVARSYSAAELESGTSATSGVRVFREAWDSGEIDPGKWDEYGRPRPRIVESLEGRSNVFDNNGDGSHDSGAVTVDGIELGAGAATISADVYVDFSNRSGCWAGAAIGLTKEAAVQTSAIGFSGGHGIWFTLDAMGDVCSTAPAEHRRRAWFNGGMLDADGNWERVAPYTVGGDDYVDGWHELRIVIDASNRVSFHADGTLLWRSTGTLDPALRSSRRLALGRRSSGSAGKAYIDNVSVVATPPANDDEDSVTRALGAGQGKWRLTVESDRRISVMSLLESPAGHLINLSTGGWRGIPNQLPVVAVPADVEVAEGEVLGVAALASDLDGSIVSWRWEQMSGPAFDLHRTDAPRFVATAPFVESDETAQFRVAVADDQRAVATAVLRVRVKASTRRLVPVIADVSIPDEVSTVRAADISMQSLESASGEVLVDESPTLLIGSDDDGTVMLSIANPKGGFLGEGLRTVSVGIDSTAVALVAVAAGYRISDIDQAIVDRIMERKRYDDLKRLLTSLMAVDKNYLDRLYDYEDVVDLIKAIALDTVLAAGRPSRAPGPTGSREVSNRSAYGASSSSRAAAIETGPIAVRYKDDFYCVPSFWPCSPWQRHEPWHWFGDARGAEAFFGDGALANIVNLASPRYRLVGDYAAIALEANRPPFLAVSNGSLDSFCLFNCTNVHAMANPNFVNYAMELYAGGVYQDWFYTPRNSTVVDKLLNSGAAYRELLAGDDRSDAGVQLGPDIDLIRFQRYRFAIAGGDSALDRGLAVSFMNAFQLIVAGVNIFTDVSAVGKAASKINEKHLAGVNSCAVEVAKHLARRGLNIYADANQGASDQLYANANTVGVILLETVLKSSECRTLAAEMAVGGELAAVSQGAKALLGAAGTAAWVKLAFDVAHETAPILASYLSHLVGRIDYHIEWDYDEEGVPYISTVSASHPPLATFDYRQKNGFNVELDASKTVAGESGRLTYGWRVNGSNIGRGEKITYNFREAGVFAVDLVVIDGNGLAGRFGSRVTVTSGRVPVVTSLICVATGGNAFSMEAEYEDADDDIASVEWRNSVANEYPDETTSADQNQVELTAPTPATWASVTVVDAQNNKASKTCVVALASRPVGKRFRDCAECPEMVVLPAGTFRMGAPRSESGSESDERPVHEVTIAAPFAVGVYEVTFAEWDACAAAGGCDGRRPGDAGWGRGRRPVIQVSWEDAQSYVQWLSRKTQKQYRLLSESEWEYAARAGTDTAYSWGDEIDVNRANCAGCGSQWDSRETAPVGSFQANDWGLHDMHGNAREWVEDCWNRSYSGAPADGSAWLSGNCSRRVLRGGSWYGKPSFLRAADRYWGTTGIRSSGDGFRVARIPTP